MEFGTFNNWKALINSMLSHSGRFERLSADIKEQTDTEVFRLKGNKSEFLTKIEAGYLDDRLFYLNINNPQIPGYIKFQEGEYCTGYTKRIQERFTGKRTSISQRRKSSKG
jgi:hypothetical protein